MSLSNNQRQLTLMVAEFDRYFSGRSNKTRLLAKLKGLFRALELEDSTWCQDFLDEWGGLEIANAMLLANEERSRFGGVENTDVQNASVPDGNDTGVLKLKKLVLGRLIIEDSDNA